MHMIERVSCRTFVCDKKHHPLRIKYDLRAPVEKRRATAPQVSLLEVLVEEGSKETSHISYSEDF
jgi:hypothetical protein